MSFCAQSETSFTVTLVVAHLAFMALSESNIYPPPPILHLHPTLHDTQNSLPVSGVAAPVQLTYLEYKMAMKSVCQSRLWWDLNEMFKFDDQIMLYFPL